MSRLDNIAVFEDTEKLCKGNELLVTAIKKSVAGQKLILESDVLTKPRLDIYANKANLIVSKKRSLEAASAYRGQNIAVHNFASASNPGGGVVKGSSAQEESLCRCSSLYFCLNVPEMWAGFYNPHRASCNPVHNDDIIFTPNVTVFKADTSAPTLLPKNDWYNVDIITCAAPNLRPNPTNRWNPADGDAITMSDESLFTLHKKRLKRILDVAASKDEEVVILGAFGCGAFMNNPEVVAKAYKEVINDYLYTFKTIEFAIYCGPKSNANYMIFKRYLSE